MTRTRAALVVGAWAVGVALGSTFGLILWAIDRGNQRMKIGGTFPDPDYDPLFDGPRCTCLEFDRSGHLWHSIWCESVSSAPRCAP